MGAAGLTVRPFAVHPEQRLNASFQRGLDSFVFILGAAMLGLAAETNEPVTATMFVWRGDELMRQGLYNQAITQYTRAIELQPDFAEAYNNRGYAAFSKYDGSDPLADLNRALELRSNFPHAYNTRGCSHMARGQTELALADFNRAIALQPDYPRALRNRANVLLKKGRFREAFADIERAGGHPWKAIGVLAGIGLLVLVLVTWLLRGQLRRKGASGPE